MELHELLERYGLTQTTLSRRFNIPLRTVQGWANGTRKAPSYVLGMMEEILREEHKLTEVNTLVQTWWSEEDKGTE